MTKSRFGMLVAIAAMACAAATAHAQSFYLENGGRVHNAVSTYASASGDGGSLSHAEGSAQAVANGSVVNQHGVIAVTGDVAGFNKATAYNTSYGSGQGSASSVGWSDASVKGYSNSTIPTGHVNVSGSVDGGMYNPVRNGTDVNVTAGTSQDGFSNAMYNGGFAINGSVSQVPIAGGVQVAGIVNDTKYSHGEVATGAVTFAGGAPVGQTAAIRYGNTGVVVNTDGSFFDPAH